MQSKTAEKYFFFGLLLLTFLFTFLIFRPFWIVFVLGISFSIVIYPVYEWFRTKKLPSWLASLLTLILFIVVLCGPLLGIGAMVFNQSQDLYHKVLDNDSAKPFMDTLENRVNRILPNVIVFDVNKQANNFVSYVSSNIANIFNTTVSAFFSFILMILIIFYLLKEGTNYREAIITWSPLGKENDEKIIDKLTQAVNGVIKGSLLIALVQGLLLGFGFWLFSIPNPALWGVVAAMLSFIPTFGTSLVSVPVIIFLFVRGDTASAIGLLLWATLIVGLVDNVLGPLVVGRSTKLPSILILFSVLGGISLWGPVGVLVGPLTLSLLFALISIYRNDFKHEVA